MSKVSSAYEGPKGRKTMSDTPPTPYIEGHPVVSSAEWIEARKVLLEKEKRLTHMRDQVAEELRQLPWVRVEKEYRFDSPEGKVTLADLFGEHSQLIVYHFMFGPGWTEGCSGCSFLADHIDAARLHVEHHDVTLLAVSHAPLEELLAYKKRMDWKFPWVSAFGSDFNQDFGVTYSREELDAGPVFHNFKMQKLGFEEQPGMSVFYKNAEGEIFHTYSGYERAGDILIGAYTYLDLTPKGRNEKGNMDWMRRHDEYEGSVRK